MRAFIFIILIAVIGSAAAYYWFSTHKPEGDPLTLAPKQTWLVFKTDNISDLHASFSDSNSFYNAIPSLSPMTQEVAEFLSPLVDAEIPAELFVAGIPGQFKFRLVLQDEVEFNAEKGVIDISESGTYTMYSSTEITEVLDEKQRSQLAKARKSGHSSTSATIDTEVFKLMLSSSFHPEILRQISSEIDMLDWMHFDLEKGHVFNATSIANLEIDQSQRKNANELFQFLPLETESAALIGTPSLSFGIVSCPYTQQPRHPSENIFILVKDTNTDRRSPSQIVIVEDTLPSIPELEFIPDWSGNCFRLELGVVDVFCASLNQARHFKNDYLGYNRFTDAKSYASLSSHISEASFSLILKAPSKHTESTFLKEINVDNEINALVIQANCEIPFTKHLAHTALHHNAIKDELRIVWKTQLDKRIALGPWEFVNHYSKQPEIVFQDRIHQLSLMNAEGKILWTRLVDHEIVEKVEMVDAFENGKNQLLFCTTKRLFLVDRNGNDLKGFPIRIDEGISAAAQAIRYSKEGDLRILVPTNKGIRNYDQHGKEVSGWNGNDLGKAMSSVSWYNLDGKDYLIAEFENHRFEIIDRSGKSRLPSVSISNPITEVHIEASSSIQDFRLVYADSIGHLVFTKLNGERHSEALLPTDKPIDLLFNPGSAAPYGFISENRIVMFDKDLNVLTDYLFPITASSHWQWMWKEENWIAVEDPSKQKLFVFDTERGLIDKMPIEGSLQSITLDLDQNGVKELVVQSGTADLSALQLSY